MKFPIFLIACAIAFIFWQLLDVFKPQIKAFGLRWTYHIQAFFEIHFWQISDIKRRDSQKRKPFAVPVEQLKDVVIIQNRFEPNTTSWKVNVKNIDRIEYETIKIEHQKQLEQEN